MVAEPIFYKKKIKKGGRHLAPRPNVLYLPRLAADHSASQSQSMAVVISPYVGDARGKLGAGVYLRSKGQTVVRGYNPSPQNRRTASQQGQRSTFGAAVKFYSRGVQNLFNFAFENKSSKESDYNAFMRYNAKFGPYWGPEQMADDLYPSIAPWVMSRGSLSPVDCIFTANDLPRVPLYDVQSPGNTPTVGEVSRLLLSYDPGYQEGDILTFVFIMAYGEPGDVYNPWVQRLDRTPVWSIGQLVIDSGNVIPFSSIGGWCQPGGGEFPFWVGDRDLGSGTAAACVVHSRITNGKLLVSDTTLKLSTNAQDVFNYSRSYAWYTKVMAAWQAESKSILQGQVAENVVDLPEGDVETYVDLPASIGDFGQAWTKIGGRLVRSKIVGGAPNRGLVFETEEGWLYLANDGDYVVLTNGTQGYRFDEVRIKYLYNATLVLLPNSISGVPDIQSVKYYLW